eukprot:GHRR01024791.1.p1 GENE.GHRR01024791.1~~GHRR01024791.1.p1  ORF type:complete len:432 (+),score=179.50 GHRR01024791.1:1302-2597(+)
MAAPQKRKRQAVHVESTIASSSSINSAANFKPELLDLGCKHLAAADSRLQPLIDEIGRPERLLAKNTSCFRSLAKSILYQQLAGTAAAAIYARFLTVCGVPDESQLLPAAVLAADPTALRACGLSNNKASYLQDLAAHFETGKLSDELLMGLSDQELLTTLTTVRGIGPWTVDMFAMFHLGRPDVLPVGDLGVRKGLAHLCGLSHLPSPSEMQQLTEHWRPYRSLGCYYMWKIPLPPTKKRAATAAGGAKKTAGKASKGKAAVSSPLGSGVAAVAAMVDVGISVQAPMLAAAGYKPTTQAMTKSAIAAIHKTAQPNARTSKSTGEVFAPITPEKLLTSVSNGNVGSSVGAVKQVAEAAAGQDSSTQPAIASLDPAVSSATTAAHAGASSASQGMMTRRRLRWAAAQPVLSGASTVVPSVIARGHKARAVDL